MLENLKHSWSPDSLERNRKILFEKLYQKAIAKEGDFLDYEGPYTKEKFLEFLVQNKNVVLHGSNRESEELEPRQANCRSKKFGNLNAVYATEDNILPIFYAIKDKEKWDGPSASGYYKVIEPLTKQVDKKYEFEIDEKMVKSKPWSDGVIYVLSKKDFDQGVDDKGNLIDEFVSRSPVKPLFRLKVEPKDFPYLNNIKLIESNV